MATKIRSKSRFEEREPLASAFFREFYRKKIDSDTKEINIETNSSEVAEIISNRLLKKIEKNVVL